MHAPLVTSPDSLGEHDFLVHGKVLSCSEVDYVSTNIDFVAAPLAWHRHAGWELLCMLGGSTGYDFQDGQKLTLSGGKFLLVPPGLAHRGFAAVREPSSICAVVLHSKPAKHPLKTFTSRELKMIVSNFTRGGIEVRTMTPVMFQTARKLQRGILSYRRGSVGNTALLTSLRFHVSSLILEAAILSQAQEKGSPAIVVENAKSFLSACYANPFTVDRLTAHTGCARTRLFRVFKQETGMTPLDWLQRLRVNKALELLHTTNRTLEDIAFRVGLTSGSYLCHAVRRYTGRTPGQHRKASLVP